MFKNIQKNGVLSLSRKEFCDDDYVLIISSSIFEILRCYKCNNGEIRISIPKDSKINPGNTVKIRKITHNDINKITEDVL